MHYDTVFKLPDHITYGRSLEKIVSIRNLSQTSRILEKTSKSISTPTPMLYKWSTQKVRNVQTKVACALTAGLSCVLMQPLLIWSHTYFSTGLFFHSPHWLGIEQWVRQYVIHIFAFTVQFASFTANGTKCSEYLFRFIKILKRFLAISSRCPWPNLIHCM